MNDDKVVSIAGVRNDSRLTTPEMVMREAGHDFVEGCWAGWPKALVIALDDRNGLYRVGMSQARMTVPEMLALMDILHASLIAEVGLNRG